MTTRRVVFDCVLFLQGAAKPQSPARACLQLLDQGQLTLCVSHAILAEITDVLTRPKTRRRFPQLTPARVDTFLEEVKAKAALLDPVPHVFSYSRDPDDEPYIDLAAAAGAECIVTWDKDLLDLMDEGKPEGRDFRKHFPGLRILDPVAFLREYRSKRDESAAPDTPGSA